MQGTNFSVVLSRDRHVFNRKIGSDACVELKNIRKAYIHTYIHTNYYRNNSQTVCVFVRKPQQLQMVSVLSFGARKQFPKFHPKP